MANLTRYTQTIFGAAAGFQQMAQYGSFAAAAPNLYDGATITPAIVQSLGAYASGWFTAVEADYSPAIEDMNALCYLFGYQLTYLMQWGIPEYDASTTYYTGSIVQYNVGANAGVLYKCIAAGGSTGVAPNTDPSKWTAPIVPDGFRVGAEIKVGLVTQTIENDSVANSTDGSLLSLVSGQSTGAGTSSLNIYKYKAGSAQIVNSDPSAELDLILNLNSGAGLGIVMTAQNNGIVNFPFGAGHGPSRFFTGIKITNVDFSMSPYSYSPTSDVAFVIFECVGGGGGGGGAGEIGGLSFLSAADGGRSAGYVKFITSGPFLSGGATINIGNKGTGGIGAGPGGAINGNPGGSTTVVKTGPSILCTANGGAGGSGHSASAGGQIVLQGNAGSSGSQIGFPFGSGTIIQGGFSGNILATSDTVGFAGDGGASFFGPGGRGGVTTGFVSMAGGNAISYGSGGGGAVLTNGKAIQNGGDGKEGYCTIYEFLC